MCTFFYRILVQESITHFKTLLRAKLTKVSDLLTSLSVALSGQLRQLIGGRRGGEKEEEILDIGGLYGNLELTVCVLWISSTIYST